MQRYNQPIQQFIFSVDKDIVFAQQETLKPPLNTIGIRRLIFFILFLDSTKVPTSYCIKNREIITRGQ